MNYAVVDPNPKPLNRKKRKAKTNLLHWWLNNTLEDLGFSGVQPCSSRPKGTYSRQSMKSITEEGCLPFFCFNLLLPSVCVHQGNGISPQLANTSNPST